MASNGQNGWNEYSKLVIAELERLNEGINSLNSEIQDLKREITEMKVKEDFAKELWRWKKEIDEVASPSQLDATVKDVTELKTQLPKKWNSLKISGIGVEERTVHKN